MAKNVCLAADLGASSGRIVAGLFDGNKLTLEDVHRFENGAVHAGGNMHWDLLRQWTDIEDGLRAASAKYGDSIGSIGVDTWGVDFGLLGRNDELLGNPRHYRDPHTLGILDTAFKTVSREDIFAASGLQFMEFNTLYQLLAMKLQQSSILDAAESMLLVPDLFHWLLTGVKSNEVTNATTTQFYNPQTKSWATDLLERFSLPTHILGELTPPGTNIGGLRQEVRNATGLSADVNVVLPGTHDTASAVMAVPAKSQPGAAPDWCYISSGTWSLMGVEVPEPVVSDRCRELNFTNEGGVGGTTRLLKNIAGLWLVQECRRIWKLGGKDYGWSELVAFAQQAAPLRSLIDPNHSCFVAPENMPKQIQQHCRDTGQLVPETEGQIIRCVLEGLALRYRLVHSWLEELSGSKLGTIHIVGGGTQNRELCQMAADACNCRVVAGPVEATAIGNLMVQIVATGAVGSIAEAREVIRNSFDVQEFLPENPAPWDDAFGRFQGVLAG